MDNENVAAELKGLILKQVSKKKEIRIWESSPLWVNLLKEPMEESR